MFFENLSPFIIPPILSLAVGIGLAILSLARGKIKIENVLFSLVCIWWVILEPAFISHFLFRGDLERILAIERVIHFFYVFLPVVNVVYFHRLFGIRRRYILYICLAVSVSLAATTPTDLYFTGLYTFSWGYIAKGGPAFQFVGLYATATIIYLIVLFVKQLRSEHNQIMRLKIRYILLSIIIVACLNFFNIPAMHGIDVYPFGNFMFIPLLFLAYGVLRYRLMDVRSMLHVTVIWAITSSLLLAPGFLCVLYLIIPVVQKGNIWQSMAVLLAFFVLYYWYIRKIQPLIDQLFNRRKYDLRQTEQDFIEKISLLRSLDDLCNEFTGVITRSLSFSEAVLMLRKADTLTFASAGRPPCLLSAEIAGWIETKNHVVEKHMVETNPEYAHVRGALLEVFERMDSSYIVPLNAGRKLIGLLFLPERSTMNQLIPNEVRFMNNIRSAAAISLSNSIMYQDLSDLKDHLEDMVDARTAELKNARDQLWGEMQLAKKIQTVLLPERPTIPGFRIAAYMQPADEVGGDYYDIINVEGLDWLVIGDVSGHGVPAGLIMMMVQTAIHTALTGKPNLKPQRLLSHINQVVTANIKKLNEDKYMTITVLACLKDGRFYFSGLHQDIMIYRAATKTVELVETDGIWLGLVDDIRGMLSDGDFFLESGDVLLLYTDGITEAWRRGTQRDERDPESDMFGDERLKGCLAALGERDSEEIRQGILDEMRDYIAADDVTLLIVKKG